MFIIDRFPSFISSSNAIPDSLGRRELDRENSTLFKTIAACIPVLGLFIAQIELDSLEEKLKKLPLPEVLRPHPTLGNIMGENASPAEIKAACERAIQLKSISRDYTKAILINSILTIALTVCAVAYNVIPFFVGAGLIGGYSITTVTHTFALYIEDRSIKRYKEISAESV
jgi:hypothetical protein